MVDPARLEVDALDRPAHRPVDLPDQLALVLGGQVGDTLEVADLAGVGEVGGGVVVRRDGGGVPAAVAAVRLVGEPGQLVRAGGLVVESDRVGEVLRAFDLGVRHGRLGRLGPVARHHPLDVGAPVDGDEDLLDVATGPVLLGLGDLLHLHAELGQRLLQRLLEVLRPRDVALPRVRHRRQRSSDVLGPRRVHPGRHLAQPVVVVPAVQVAYGDAAPADLLDDQVDGQELTQVAEVDGPGGAGSRGAGDQLGALAGVPDRVVGRPGDPVMGFGAGSGGLLATCHEFAAPARWSGVAASAG